MKRLVACLCLKAKAFCFCLRCAIFRKIVITPDPFFITTPVPLRFLGAKFKVSSTPGRPAKNQISGKQTVKYVRHAANARNLSGLVLLIFAKPLKMCVVWYCRDGRRHGVSLSILVSKRYYLMCRQYRLCLALYRFIHFESGLFLRAISTTIY